MGKIYQGIDELVGHTPLVNLHRLAAAEGVKAEILAKLEYFNPAGSAKDRIGRQMIEDAEASGDLVPGSVIIEPTSGNTGVGLAAMAAAKGYRVVITMPENFSEERKLLLKAHGAELILTDKAKGMAGAIEKAEELQKTMKNGWIAGQFVNPSNPKAHYISTGPEIWEDTIGQVNVFVASVGTGGTLTGTANYLKEQNPNIHVVAVEPAGSPVLSGGEAGSHGIQGIGAGFVPEILDTEIYDEIMKVTEASAYGMSRLLSAKEGFLVGISSGAALWAAVQLGKRPENHGKKIVVILPDTGERYLSTELFRE
ncbi:MAG: cysteine synthase A [Clostridium sp.]